MFSLSTSWNSFRHKTGRGLVEEAKSAGFDTVELNFALTEGIVKEVLASSRRSEIKVSSLHNMCPLPPEIGPDKASPDFYSLASPLEEERRLAVDIAKNTIRYAKMFGASAIVLHAGRVQIKDRTGELASLSEDRPAFEKLRSDMIRERIEKKDGHLDNVMKSLSELIPYSAGMGVRIGLENRYYYREIPVADELEAIFDNFGSGIYYWHDVGHAEVFDRLGITKHLDLLDRFAGRLIGVHLHDIIGYINDHRVPGAGTFDFGIIKPYLKKDTIRVIEAHGPATADELRRGAQFLEKILT